MRFSLTSTTALAAVLAATAALASPEVPGAPQDRPIALAGATVHPVSGPAIESATILFDGGKIVAIGRDLAVPEKAERVDVSGKHLYPGLIDANSQLGLVEVPSIRGTRDQSETGLVNPNVKAEVAFNPDSELIPVGRSGGILTVLTVPSGGLITGLSACMQLDGWTWEEMCLRPAIGLHIAWPRMQPIEAWWIEDSAGQQNESRDRALKTIRQALADSRAYRNAKLACALGKGPEPEHDARWEAMIGVLEGKTRVFIEADDIQQIQAALAFAEQEGLKAVIVGGYDAADCAALLKKHDVPVIVGGVHRLPWRPSDDYDAAFTLPERLRKAGIPFCIAGTNGGASGSQPSNIRNLPYHAAAAAAYGLPADEALRSITLYPAQILGVADSIGSLEPGKDATLIVTTGDPLEITTHVTAAYIQGRAVDLNDRHKRLWEKYKEKYRRLGIKN
ncbi:MAG: amidohydrolase family protein [Pirellulales bacterium]